MIYLLRRLGFLLITLWAAISINFLIPRLMPGNPAQALMAKFHGRINPSAYKSMALAFGVTNEPLWKQYVSYFDQVAHGQFGISISSFPSPVLPLVEKSLMWTLFLVGTATVISFILGNIFGILAAWYRGGWFDSLSTITFTFTSAFPYFWFALVILFVFGFQLNWFPNAYAHSTSIDPGWNLRYIADVLDHALLPAFTIVVSSMGGWLLGIRNNMMGILGEDYILLARAKGLFSGRIIYAYAARTAILPNITAFAMSLGFVVSGAVLTEIVFSYPGIGSLLFTAVEGYDYPLMQAIFLVIVICVVIANFLADLVLVLIDPRVRQEAA